MTCEIVCVQYKRGNSSLYLIFLLICQFIIECSDVEAFFAAVDFWSIALFYQISNTVSCWKIINYSLSFECELTLLFFLCKQFNLTFYYCSLLTVDCFQSKSFVWISIAWNFQSVIFLMQFIKRNFWWHTCLGHFLGNWFDIKVCCTS